jgi:hypothetical protein
VNVTPVKAKGKSLHKGKGKPRHKQHLQARVSDEDSLSECDIMDDEFDDAAPGLSDGDSGQLDEFHSAREASSGEDLRDGICDDGSSSDNSGSDDKAVRFLMHVVPRCAIKLHHVEHRFGKATRTKAWIRAYMHTNCSLYASSAICILYAALECDPENVSILGG